MSVQGLTRGRAGRAGGYAGSLVAAGLSVLAGAGLAAALLAIQPVNRVKELPAASERERGAVYFVEGQRDPARMRSAPAKIESLLRGQRVTFAEEDINGLLEAGMAARGKTPDDAAVSPGSPNVRIRDGVVQVALEVTVKVLGLKQKILVQARGGFVAESGQWVFAPQELRVGGLPLERIPLAVGWVQARWLDPRRFFPELAAAWNRIGQIAVEDSVVRVSLR
jgi:hypothetical protein